jgi:hypothetical protein
MEFNVNVKIALICSDCQKKHIFQSWLDMCFQWLSRDNVKMPGILSRKRDHLLQVIRQIYTFSREKSFYLQN